MSARKKVETLAMLVDSAKFTQPLFTKIIGKSQDQQGKIAILRECPCEYYRTKQLTCRRFFKTI